MFLSLSSGSGLTVERLWRKERAVVGVGCGAGAESGVGGGLGRDFYPLQC